MVKSFRRISFLARSNPYNTRDLENTLVSGLLRYLGICSLSLPNIRPENATARPALSKMGNITRERNRSYVFPFSVFERPARAISSAVNPFWRQNSEQACHESGANPTRHDCMVSSEIPRLERYARACSFSPRLF